MRAGRAPAGRPMTAGRSMVGGRRFAEGGSPKSSEEGDLNPFGSNKKTIKKLNEIYPPKKPKSKKMAKGGKCYAGGGVVGKNKTKGYGCAERGNKTFRVV
jgi:hypothetical protein